MRTTIIRFIKLSLAIVVLMATLGNSGCLVNTGSDLDKLKKLNQANLRIYNATDTLKYDVLVDGVNKGTLTISYSTPSPTENPDSDPLATGFTPIPDLLKETTELDYNNGTQTKTVRYITQDRDPLSPTYGSITLHAFNSQSSTAEHNYASTNSKLDAQNSLSAPVIFTSPFLEKNGDTFQPIAGQADENIAFNVFPCYEISKPDQCETNPNQSLSESFELSKMVVYNLSNNVDFFETVRVPYNGSANSVNGLIDQRKILLDIRAFCGNPTDTAVTYSGKEFLYPSVGIIRIELNCNSSTQGPTFLSADISSVNFPY